MKQVTMLRRTPLYSLHESMGARFAPFAGYEMPVQFEHGIIKEHHHTRSQAGLFDVSHMGQIRVIGQSDIALALETLVPGDLVSLGRNQLRYTLLLNEKSGVLDDLIVANLDQDWLLVVNANRKYEDLAYLQQSLPDIGFELLENRGLISLQGPEAENVLKELCQGVSDLRFMTGMRIKMKGVDTWITRTGYTGEDGFEISCLEEDVMLIAKCLLNYNAVLPIGLGARDTLRLEAGLCLYGSDLNEQITPVEANLNWTIPVVRRENGARAGGFVGSEKTLQQLQKKTEKRRIGFISNSRIPVREGGVLYDQNDREVGMITSGGFSPTLNCSIAMGLVKSDSVNNGTPFFTNMRNKKIELNVACLPFVETKYRR